MSLPRVLVAALLALAVPLVQSRIDARQDRERAQREVLYVGDGRLLHRLLPGFRILAADLYWLRTVQYYGGKLAFEGDTSMELLYPLADVTTTLDPRLEIAYRYGAIFLCEPAPRGAGDCEAGLRLLGKGVANLPGAWGIRQDVGYLRYLFMGDAQGAARSLHEAARLPGAPPTLGTLAGRLLERAGDTAEARWIWQDLLEQYPEGFMRDTARYHLQHLDSLDVIAYLTEFSRRRLETGKPAPTSVEELARLGVNPRLLRDGTGVPFVWDAGRRQFWFRRDSRLWQPL